MLHAARAGVFRCRHCFFACVLALAAVPAGGAENVRLFVLTDIGGDPDDVMSMVRPMTYANHLEIEGLAATHCGRGRVNPERIRRVVYRLPEGARQPGAT